MGITEPATKPYDSRLDTLRHIETVRYFLKRVIDDLGRRWKRHDKSKLLPPEKPIFDQMTPKLAGCTYGSAEYEGYRAQMGVALEHHYEVNSHHPEHFEDGIKGMSLIDLLEMVCDWKAATLRHNDGDIDRSIEINQQRFGYSDELKQIIFNTVRAIE